MLSIHIPRIASDAGKNSDGEVVGGTKRTALIASYTNIPVATNVAATRKDVKSNGSFLFTNIITESGTNTGNLIHPFGLDADLSATDKLYISDAGIIKSLYFQINTSGVWVGDGFRVAYSTDGITDNKEVSNLVDGTNGK